LVLKPPLAFRETFAFERHHLFVALTLDLSRGFEALEHPAVDRLRNRLRRELCSIERVAHAKPLGKLSTGYAPATRARRASHVALVRPTVVARIGGPTIARFR
jgi:hypothetical protein